ncbi:hypothetical protein F5ESL0225_08000 [Lactobacillus sp. ESL0225]|uniref:hypothetical protein n=1 Tax=unclassified Lactobacillus TaxID=2620435 RepID=UPI000EFBC725|nr:MULTISPECIES: hypothetical protein [unclassified Lactobacillus]RMC38136.1 hypothetical protein F5ESL0237_07815 [Lactobacillus sp. ESL0237]RMC42653.1 hypothetical protein F5ESL0234_07640 [Lactobacillus sp. ESL0234]RMC43364.1 hypothetical protein F5ESL0236_07840 [Lactobacillus sp. ESL0236]RMC47866.1 hypothetical protein F5ESL0225_08000 [Lactobacillus sp. ESL0225]
MKFINLIFNFVFELLDKLCTFAMLHVKLCLALWLLFMIFIIFVAKMANSGKIFGFWWQLNQALDNFVNNGLIITSILLTIVFIAVIAFLLSVYKGL